MAELADGTGGTFFHNSNDLETGLKELSERPECLYVLELPLGDVKRNGSLHSLTVKVNRQGAQVTARRRVLHPQTGQEGQIGRLRAGEDSRARSICAVMVGAAMHLP